MSGKEANISLNMSALPDGLHSMAYRVRSNSGLFSVPYMHYFLKVSGNVEGEADVENLQYWIDSFANQNTMPAASGTINLDVDAKALAFGVHIFYYRVKDSRGMWSPVESQFFLKVEPKLDNLITSYRYWFNDASADARTVELSTPQSPFALQTNIKPFHLVKESELTDENRTTIKGADGTERIAALNTLHIMFRDSYGKWSEQQIDTFAAPLAKDAEVVGSVENVRLLSIDNPDEWNSLGKSVGVNVSGHYSHKAAYSANIYYNVDDGATRMLVQNVANGADFTAKMECVFSDKPIAHTIKLFAIDSEEAATDTVIFSIPDMRNTTLYGVPSSMMYTGQSITLDGISVVAHSTGETLAENQYGVEYANNVDDGMATVFAVGKFPYYIGKSYGNTFTIESTIVDAEIAVLREFYTNSHGAEEWNYKWDNLGNDQVKVNELHGVSGKNGHVTSIILSGNNMRGDLSILYRLLKLERLDASDNRFEGTLDMSEIKPSLKYLNVRDNSFANIEADIPESLTDCYFDYQSIDVRVDFHNVLHDVEAFLDMIPNIVFYDISTKRLNRDSFSGNLYTCVNKERDQIVLRFDRWKGQTTISGRNDFYGSKGDSLVWEAGCGSKFFVRYMFDDGDANMDTRVDVNDLVVVRNRILERRNDCINFTAANIWNGDNVINVQDAVCLVNILLESTPSAASLRNAESKFRIVGENGEFGCGEEETAPAVICVADGKLLLCSNEPVAAFDIIVKESQASQCHSLLAARGFTVSMRQQGNDLHIVGYSLSGSSLPIGVVEIAAIGSNSNSYVSAAQLSSPEAKSINVVGDVVDAIGTIGVVEGEGAVYNAAGIRANGLTHGINIIKSNGIVRKVYNK